MKKRFLRLFENLKIKENPNKKFEKLVSLYYKPERFYHILKGHINNCLIEFDSVKGLIKEPNKIEISI